MHFCRKFFRCWVEMFSLFFLLYAVFILLVFIIFTVLFYYVGTILSAAFTPLWFLYLIFIFSQCYLNLFIAINFLRVILRYWTLLYGHNKFFQALSFCISHIDGIFVFAYSEQILQQKSWIHITLLGYNMLKTSFVIVNCF